MARPWNFSAGPAAIPEAVLRQAAAQMLDWHGSGMSVMEMSHRGKHFVQICDEAEGDLRELLSLPSDYAILFMQGGGLGENAIVPMNLLGRRASPAADFLVTGHWSVRSHKEAGRYGDARVIASSAQATQIDGREQLPWTWVPGTDTWTVNRDAAYLHLCSNETIGGLEYMDWPDMAALGAPDVPLVVDASSHFLSRALPIEKTGLVFAGAQKNVGPAGVTVVIARRDLLGHALSICPSAFDYANVAAEHSRYNTPPTFGIYMAGLVFKWIKALGGVAAIEAANIAKSELLYGCLDASGFYRNPVHKPLRSRMNVPFVLRDESLNDAFLAGADQAGLLALKGHKSVGGMRASIYNAMPLEGVQALVDYLKDFERRYG
ncbi:3-phosphoserine/phosphohydroxythreonine transaminase [Bordetella sp. FB-8]|uniref:3-phosphoserine/phosphohydroxythreonine transaminase n=1 Tax=Bordetella sp. FB-8 TaxID=1159870 RepID=UPI00037CCB27|nr:3-phosphoserine/phosphohydroxythreonine transaminase [Bordetella sp. FB-8]